MNEQYPFGEEFEVSRKYRIDINGGLFMFFGHLRNNEYGECYINVYEKFNKGNEIPERDCLGKIGSFIVEDVPNISAEDFLKEIRRGIEKIVSSKREVLETIN